MVKKFTCQQATFKIKAKEIATSNDFKTFMALNGWLEFFSHHHNFSFKVLASKSNAMDQDVVQNCKSQLTFLLREYSFSDIWNMDKTGLLWQGLLTKSLTEKAE